MEDSSELWGIKLTDGNEIKCMNPPKIWISAFNHRIQTPLLDFHRNRLNQHQKINNTTELEDMFSTTSIKLSTRNPRRSTRYLYFCILNPLKTNNKLFTFLSIKGLTCVKVYLVPTYFEGRETHANVWRPCLFLCDINTTSLFMAWDSSQCLC